MFKDIIARVRLWWMRRNTEPLSQPNTLIAGDKNWIEFPADIIEPPLQTYGGDWIELPLTAVRVPKKRS